MSFMVSSLLDSCVRQGRRQWLDDARNARLSLDANQA
jgi:hypothetical protein